MSGYDSAIAILAILVVSLLPALAYLVWIRGKERYRTLGWSPIGSAFVFGAVIATVIAALLEAGLIGLGTSVSQAYPAPEFTFLNGSSTWGAFFAILVIAPFIEEGIKGLGVVSRSGDITHVADGAVFGASVGLGFGFLETALYGIVGYATGGLVGAIALVLVRSLSSVLLHGSSTAMFGYGYARSRLLGERGATGRYYLLAVGMHASFNVLASLGALAVALGGSASLGSYADLLALLAAIVFATAAFEHVARLVHSAEYPATQPGTARLASATGRRQNGP